MAEVLCCINDWM